MPLAPPPGPSLFVTLSMLFIMLGFPAKTFVLGTVKVEAYKGPLDQLRTFNVRPQKKCTLFNCQKQCVFIGCRCCGEASEAATIRATSAEFTVVI